MKKKNNPTEKKQLNFISMHMIPSLKADNKGSC